MRTLRRGCGQVVVSFVLLVSATAKAFALLPRGSQLAIASTRDHPCAGLSPCERGGRLDVPYGGAQDWVRLVAQPTAQRRTAPSATSRSSAVGVSIGVVRPPFQQATGA